MKKILQFFDKRKKLTLVLSILWTILIIIGCSLPGRDLPKLGLFDHFDKVVHFTFFVIFFIGWYLISFKSINYILFIFLISICFGFGIEYYQLNFIAGRSFDVWDGVADSAGALAGLGIVRYNKI